MQCEQRLSCCTCHKGTEVQWRVAAGPAQIQGMHRCACSRNFPKWEACSLCVEHCSHSFLACGQHFCSTRSNRLMLAVQGWHRVTTPLLLRLPTQSDSPTVQAQCGGTVLLRASMGDLHAACGARSTGGASVGMNVRMPDGVLPDSTQQSSSPIPHAARTCIAPAGAAKCNAPVP